MTLRFSLAPAARADIIDILDWSMQHFGSGVRDGYESLIVAALDMIRNDPLVTGSRARTDLADGLRTLHLRACRNEVAPGKRRIANPRHFVVYRILPDAVQVVRVLHDATDISPLGPAD